MDKSLGDVMDYLEKRGLTKNTLLVFMSDNGGLSDVRRGAANLNQYNSPARSGKTSGYDGGLRIPMLAQWPGHIAAGSTCGNNVIVEDFFATCLALSGLKKPAMVQRVDGQSWLPLFAGKKAYTNRPITWHYPHQHMGRHADVYPFSAIRQGSWKLLYNHTTQGLELYNTLTDVGEQNNLAASEPKRVKQMAAQLGKALRSSPVGMPVDKATKVGMGYPDGVVNKK
jgi:arylsulfatase A-like enzyme